MRSGNRKTQTSVVLILAVFVSTGASCTTTKGKRDEAVDRAAELAAQALDRQFAPIPANLLATPVVKLSSVAQKRDEDQRIVRAKWQYDRDAARMCIVTHETLVGELKVRNLVPQ